MLLYIARFRLYLTKVNRLEEALAALEKPAEAAAEDILDYKVEFELDRLYTTDKITPVNLSGDDDKTANKKKLFEAEKMRGTKIVRIARRVSGQLLQLTVFEVPEEILESEELKESPTTLPGASPSSRPGTSTSTKADTMLQLAFSPVTSNHTQNEIADETRPLSQHAQRSDGKPGTANSIAGTNTAAAATATATATATASSTSTKSGRAATPTATKSSVTKHTAPTLRVIGYDPRSRRKLVCIAPAQAVLEVAGGPYSNFLDPLRRRELARLLCESLLLVFPRGKPFELFVPWSGADTDAMSAAVMGDKGSWRNPAENTKKRAGKFFRAGLRVGKLDLVVTAYSPVISGSTSVSDGKAKAQELLEMPITFNFYSNGSCQSIDVIVTKQEQIDRIGHTITSVADGAARAAAVRRFCRFFQAEHKADDKGQQQVLTVQLLASDKGYLGDYRNVGLPPPGEDTRPVGIPAVFAPLDIKGKLLHQCAVSLPIKGGIVPSDEKEKTKEYVVSMYTKSVDLGAEKGLVLKLYDPKISDYSILHIGTPELLKMCMRGNTPTLLEELHRAKLAVDKLPKVSELEAGLESLTEKGEVTVDLQRLNQTLVEYVLADLCVTNDAMNKTVPYLKSMSKGATYA
jgi:hypothetical protein